MIINPFVYKKVEGGGSLDLKLNGIELIFDTNTDIEIGMTGRNSGTTTYGTAYKWAIFLDGDYLKVEEGVTSATQVITIENDTAGLHRVTMLCMLDNQDYCARSVCFYGSGSIGSYDKLISAKGIGTGFDGTSTLAPYCYYYMFRGCTNLTTAPELPATTLAERCYSSMFYGCTNLTTAPELPVTTLAPYCYYNMFYSCTNLTTAPELPATTLAERCYYHMFRGCTNLTTAPELPATTLAERCYYYMFYGCTNLTTAPELPATTLASYCYSSMFRGCINLAEVKCYYASNLSSTYASNWLSNAGSAVVSPSNKGKLYSPNAVITYGMPNNWENLAL